MLSPVSFHCSPFGGNIILISVLLSFTEFLVLHLLLLAAADGADALFFSA